jgi:hypothetical protein
MGKDSNLLPLENSKVLPILVGKGWSVGGQQIGSLKNEDFAPYTV